MTATLVRQEDRVPEMYSLHVEGRTLEKAGRSRRSEKQDTLKRAKAPSPPHITFGEAEGFPLSLAKQALHGNLDDVIQTVKGNVHIV